MTYEEYKKAKSELDELMSPIEIKMNKIPTGAMGLPDNKDLPKLNALKKQWNPLWKKLQDLNSYAVKNFKKEMQAERKAKIDAKNKAYWEKQQSIGQLYEAQVNKTTLTKSNIKEGAIIISKNNPEWGTWRVQKDQTGWTIEGNSGGKILADHEFKYWDLVR